MNEQGDEAEAAATAVATVGGYTRTECPTNTTNTAIGLGRGLAHETAVRATALGRGIEAMAVTTIRQAVATTATNTTIVDKDSPRVATPSLCTDTCCVCVSVCVCGG